jgi:predicted dehydrogenase
MNGPPLAVVVVGAGLMGRWHAHAARRAGALVRAVVDPDLARAEALAGRHAGARPFVSFGAALAAGPVDAAHICTPVATHEALAVAALEAGCHVLIEKPFGPDLAVTRRLLSRAESAQRVICPVHQFLFQRGVLRALELLPTFGPLRHFEMRVCSAGAAGRSDGERERVAMEILPHALALAARFCNAPIVGADWQLLRAGPGELLVSALVGGVAVRASVSMAGRPPVNELLLVGEHGAVHADLFHGFAFVETGGVSRAAKIVRPVGVALRHGAAAAGNLLRRAAGWEPAYPGLAELVRRFYAAARGAVNPIAAAETLAVAEVWERLGATVPSA